MSGGRKILLVEDEPSLVLTLTDRLIAEGYQVETAHDGDSGVEKAAAGSFDMVLLDVMLPGKDGFEVCRAIRAESAVTLSIDTMKPAVARAAVAAGAHDDACTFAADAKKAGRASPKTLAIAPGDCAAP